MKTQGSLYTLRGLLFLLIASSNAYGNSMIEAWQNRTGSAAGFSFGPKITFFNTNQNYNINSEPVLLPNNISLQRYYIDLNLSYGFDENMFIFGRISGLYTNITGTGLSNETIFGLSDQMIGGSYRIFQNNGGLSINLQSDVTIPAYSNASSVNNGKPFLGDGSFDFNFGAFTEIPISNNKNYQIFLDGGAAYSWRSNGYSSAIPWSVWLKRYPTFDGLTLGLGMRGNFSFENDVQSTGAAILDQNRGAGGSYIINAKNPNWNLVQASIGYQTKSNINYALNGAIPVYGTNSANGTQISLGAQFEFGENGSKKKSTTIVRRGSFKQYDLEGKVTSVNDQLYLVKIDQGLDQGIEKGQIFDIFIDNQAIAKAKVTQVKNDESALIVLEYYKEQSIEVDATAKRLVQDP